MSRQIDRRRCAKAMLSALLLLPLIFYYREFVSSVGVRKISLNHAPWSGAKNDEAIASASSGDGRRSPPTPWNMRTLDESKLPFRCGVIFFYHVACTGGRTINKWLVREGKENNDTTSYYTFWGRNDKVQDRFISDMEATQVRNISENEWRIVHAHGYSFFPNSSEHHLYEWRGEVERQGCGFVAATVLRDAVDHSVSMTKNMWRNNYTFDGYFDHLMPGNEDVRGFVDGGGFSTQLDYILYNLGPRNEFNATKEEKVRRALELLRRHFDVVLLSDHDTFERVILRVTGWRPAPMVTHNVHRGELEFTERELVKLKGLTERNGDVAFVDAVRHIYHGRLDYLLV